MSNKQDLHLCLDAMIAQLDADNVLTVQTQMDMNDALVCFCEAAIVKFIKGQKEHGGRIQDRDLDAEIANEHIDTFWYGAAKEWK